MNSRIKRLVNPLFSATLALACVNAATRDIPEVEDHSRKELAPISDDLREFLTSREVGALVLVNATGEVEIIGLEGRPVEPCGRVVGTEITGDCNLANIDLLNLNHITILVSETNPKCVGYIDQDSGDAYQIHAGGDKDHLGRFYRKGWVDCHVTPKGQHGQHHF